MVAIEAIGVFQGLAPQGLKDVAARARVEQLAGGVSILSQGENAGRAYAVISGAVRVRQTGRDGAQTLIRMIAPGELFGAVALFTDNRYPADAETATESVIVSWSEADFLALITRQSVLAVNMIRMIGTRLAEAQERIRELATQSADRRIAHVLLRLVEVAGASRDGGVAIEMPLRRKDVAELAGTTLHTASRVLAAWEKAGLLARSRQALTVRDLTSLRWIASDGPAS